VLIGPRLLEMKVGDSARRSNVFALGISLSRQQVSCHILAMKCGLTGIGYIVPLLLIHRRNPCYSKPTLLHGETLITRLVIWEPTGALQSHAIPGVGTLDVTHYKCRVWWQWGRRSPCRSCRDAAPISALMSWVDHVTLFPRKKSQVNLYDQKLCDSSNMINFGSWGALMRRGEENSSFAHTNPRDCRGIYAPY